LVNSLPKTVVYRITGIMYIRNMAIKESFIVSHRKNNIL